MYRLIIVTGPCRSVAVRINPLQAVLIRTYPYLYRSKPLFIHSAHHLDSSVGRASASEREVVGSNPKAAAYQRCKKKWYK